MSLITLDLKQRELFCQEQEEGAVHRKPSFLRPPSPPATFTCKSPRERPGKASPARLPPSPPSLGNLPREKKSPAVPAAEPPSCLPSFPSLFFLRWGSFSPPLHLSFFLSTQALWMPAGGRQEGREREKERRLFPGRVLCHLLPPPTPATPQSSGMLLGGGEA